MTQRTYPTRPIVGVGGVIVDGQQVVLIKRKYEPLAGRWSIPGGTLEVGEPSVVIAAVSAHRAEAYAASRFAIERVKQISPVWKREHLVAGESWVEGATVDPDDPVALEQAWRRACP